MSFNKSTTSPSASSIAVSKINRSATGRCYTESMTIDPIQLELMRNLFEAAADEMGITLQRVAFSANIKERRDFSCAIFDPAGELLAQAAHIPVHLGSMGDSVRAVLQALGALADGDVAIVNDPFAGGTHLPDITLVSPVFTGNSQLASGNSSLA